MVTNSHPVPPRCSRPHHRRRTHRPRRRLGSCVTRMVSASSPCGASWNCQLSQLMSHLQTVALSSHLLWDLLWPGRLPAFPGALARSPRCAHPATWMTSGSEAQLGDYDPRSTQAGSLPLQGWAQLCIQQASSKHPSVLNKQERNACLCSHLGSLVILRSGLESQL